MATRRIIIAALVVLCLALFSLFAREGSGGPLHGVQSAVGSLMSPFQGVTSKAVKPLRDGWRWVNDMSEARDRVQQLEADNRALATQLAQQRFQQAENRRINALEGLGDNLARDYTARPAAIVATSPSPWYDRAVVDVGSADGVMVNSPVLARGFIQNEALAGIVTHVSRNRSTVTFLSEGSTAVGVTIESSGAKGLAQPSVAGQMMVRGILRRASVKQDDPVYTSGAASPATLPSPYPRGIPVGFVAGVGAQESDEEWTVQLTPYVRPAELDYVVVLAPTSDKAKRRADPG